jgi:predicted PurR-regulated permease PerM
MLVVINILTILFLFLIFYQLILAYIKGGNSYINIIDGFETAENKQYQPYDTSNPQNVLILEQQNAGNISYLKQRVDGIQNLNKEVQDISGNVSDLQEQMVKLMAAQQQYTQRMTGGKVPQITGAVQEATK